MNNTDQTIRELMLALEYCRKVCEHARGVDEKSSGMLISGMRVAMRALDKHSKQITDFQQPSYWKEVSLTPQRLEDAASNG
jgi:hypothetical protein